MLTLEFETAPETQADGQREFFRWKCRECETIGVVSHKGVIDDVVLARTSDQHASVTRGCPATKAVVLDLLENWSRGEGVERLPKKFRATIYECPACDSWTRGTFCLPCIE
jgi:hypothetical protein